MVTIGVFLLGCGLAVGGPTERCWDQAEAVRRVERMLAIEHSGQPWREIPWRTDPWQASREAASTGKPLFVWFYQRKATGPAEAPCCAGGRMMRALALSDPYVQLKIRTHFVPLELPIEPGTKEFPLDWPALTGWRIAYALLGGERNDGFTGGSVVSPDLMVEYASTGSAMPWELFDSPAYDAEKMAALLSRGLQRAEEERALREDRSLSVAERTRRLAAFRRELSRKVGEEGRLRLPPPGFTLEGALELFRLTGDWNPPEP